MTASRGPGSLRNSDSELASALSSCGADHSEVWASVSPCAAPQGHCGFPQLRNLGPGSVSAFRGLEVSKFLDSGTWGRPSRCGLQSSKLGAQRVPVADPPAGGGPGGRKHSWLAGPAPPRPPSPALLPGGQRSPHPQPRECGMRTDQLCQKGRTATTLWGGSRTTQSPDLLDASWVGAWCQAPGCEGVAAGCKQEGGN